MPASEGLGDQMRLVLGVEFVAEVLDVPFNRPRGDAQLQCALLGGEPASNALQHLALTLRQVHEIFLLPRKIHHALRCWDPFARVPLISLVITDLQEVERFVSIPDKAGVKCEFPYGFRDELVQIQLFRGKPTLMQIG